VLEKLAAMQMIDVELPTTDDRVVVMASVHYRDTETRHLKSTAKHLCFEAFPTVCHFNERLRDAGSQARQPRSCLADPGIARRSVAALSSGDPRPMFRISTSPRSIEGEPNFHFREFPTI